MGWYRTGRALGRRRFAGVPTRVQVLRVSYFLTVTLTAFEVFLATAFEPLNVTLTL
jgi:hypothetical protein